MIDVACSFCGNALFENGALLFSPPGPGNVVVKYHICTNCFLTRFAYMLPQTPYG